MVFIMAITAFGAEDALRLFTVSPDEKSTDEIIGYALEKGFDGIAVDLRGEDSLSFYKKLSSAVPVDFVFYLMIDDSLIEKVDDVANIIADFSLSEESLSSLAEKTDPENILLYLPFGEDFSSAAALYEKELFGGVFAENLLSCHSENGYEEYLLEIKSLFPGAEITTVNDLSKVLTPTIKGDFYGDRYELNNQYLINNTHGAGFCVSDYSALSKNAFGSGSFLTESFKNTALTDYADFSVSQEFAITRPTKSKLNISTEKYTIFGTSNPDSPLYLNGEEVERISEGGLFAVTVEVPKKGKTFNFTQDEKTLSVTLTRNSGSSGGTSTTSKLTSLSPSADKVISPDSSVVTLSCVGPSGAKVTAKVGEKVVLLEQARYADPGVPATFTGKIDLSGSYPSNEVTDLGKVSYTLKYKGITTNFESAGNIYHVGEEATLSIMANCELAGVEKEASEKGNYLTTLRTGCTSAVTEITENGWYKLSSGGYMKSSHIDVLTGNIDPIKHISSAKREIAPDHEKLVFTSDSIPAFSGKISGKTFSLTLYDTEWSDFSSTDTSSNLMYRINPVDNGDGSITVKIFSKVSLWGWDIFTDPENNSFSLVLTPVPKLSDNTEKPLSGIKVAVCAGHGGPDPGALSVAGEKGVNEAQINIANTMAIAEALENLGAETLVLTTFDEKLDTYGRTDPARYALCDVYICCHANSIAESSNANLWCGTYVYYHFDHSAEFSKKLCDYISAETKRDNEGAVQDYYSVTRLTICPAVMLEVGFVSNPKELESLIDPADIQKTALAVTKAVLEIVDN